jgi:ketosteroid isomerase-like protein
MAEHPNATLIGQAYAAFNRGDMEGLFAVFSDDILWHELTGKWALAGDHVGKHAVAEFFGEMQAHGMTAIHLEPHDILASDDHVVGLVTVHIERGEHKIDQNEVHVWHLKDGKATEGWLTAQDPDAHDAFWAA